MSKRLLPLLVICVLIGPLVCIQFQRQPGDLDLGGGNITSELYGWPFVSFSTWKNELNTRGNAEYLFSYYHPLNIVLNSVVVMILGGLVCLFLFQIQRRRDFKFYLFDIFALTFAIACCLAVHQFGPQLLHWTVDTFDLSNRTKAVVGTQPTTLMLYAYLLVAAFAVFQVVGRFLNQTPAPAVPIVNSPGEH